MLSQSGRGTGVSDVVLDGCGGKGGGGVQKGGFDDSTAKIAEMSDRG